MDIGPLLELSTVPHIVPNKEPMSMNFLRNIACSSSGSPGNANLQHVNPKPYSKFHGT